MACLASCRSTRIERDDSRFRSTRTSGAYFPSLKEAFANASVKSNCPIRTVFPVEDGSFTLTCPPSRRPECEIGIRHGLGGRKFSAFDFDSGQAVNASVSGRVDLLLI